MRLAASNPMSVAVQVDTVVNDQSLSRADEKFNRLLEKGIQAVKDGNLELAASIDKDLGKYTGVAGDAKIRTSVETVVDGKGEKHFKSIQNITTKNIANLTKMKSINANSVTSLRQQVNTLKQQRDILNPMAKKVDSLGNTYEATNPKVQELNEKIAQKSELLQKALGIQEGSISAIQREINLLEQKRAKMAAIASVPTPGGGTAVVQVMNPQMKEVTAELEKQQALLRQAQGIQKGSVADLEAEIALLKEKARVTKKTNTYLDKYGNTVTEVVEMNEEDKKILEEKEGQLRKVKGIQDGSKTALQEQLAIATKQRDNTSRLLKVTDRYGKVIGTKVNPQWTVSNKNVTLLQGKIKKLNASTGGLGGRIGQFAMGLGQAQMALQGVLMLQQAVNAAVGAFVARQKQIQALKLTFDGIGVGLEGQEAILKSASAVALTYGQSLSKVEAAYKRLGPAIQQSGGSLQDTQLAIETIAARTTQLGLNTEQTGRYIEAFAQVLGKGKLQGEELNQQFAELDGALRGQLQSFIEAEYGITDFNEAMKAGEITGQMFLDSMIAIGEEARGKIAQDMGKLSESIAKIGEEGGPTIQQLQNQLETLSTIGLGEVGKTLGGLGKSLMAIQAAFVQVFTKVATEMPAIQKAFKATFDGIGTFLELAFNGLTLLFGVIMRDIERFLNWLDSIPVVRNFFKDLSDGSDELKTNLRVAIDDFSELNEATTGSLRVIKQYENELGNLREELESGNLTTEERIKKQAEYDELLAKRTAAEAAAREKQLSDQYASTREVLTTLIAQKKEQLAVEEQIAKRKIETIQAADAAEKEAYTAEVAAVKARGDKYREMIDEKIRNTKKFFETEKALIDESIRAQRAYGQEMKDKFSGATAAVEQYYASLKQAEENRHKQAISNLDSEIAKVKEKYASEISSLDSGPQQDKMKFMELDQLRKQARTAETAYERQRARAQIESIQNAQIKAELEQEQAEELKQLEEDKAREEKRNAEEKARLDAEEKARKEALAAADRQVQKEILAAIEALSGRKRDMTKEEKRQVDELKELKRKSNKEDKDFLDEIKEKRDANHKKRTEQIKAIKKGIESQKDAVEDVELALQDLPAEAKKLESAVDYVTNGALERQLAKVRKIKSELGNIKGGGNGGGGNSEVFDLGDSGDDEGIVNNSPDPFRASGGPVTGGTEYTVNELGREGFVSSSGKISEITAPAFGTWKAPAMGTVVPAHIWKQYKKAKKAMKSNLSSVSETGFGKASDSLGGIQEQGVVKEILQNNNAILPIETREEQKTSKKQPRFKLPTLKDSKKNRDIKNNLESYKEKEIRKEKSFQKKEELKVNTPVFNSLKAPSGSTKIPAYVWSEVKQPRRSSGALSSKGSIGVSSSSVTNVNNINKSKSTNSSSNTVYNNSVTVQSSNPTQTANNMLVELTKVRRRRLGR
ncbi:tape measure domain [Synechococcus phage S-CRES2]|nr:tape measure domain [Synechococcus phage S-CRES2]